VISHELAAATLDKIHPMHMSNAHPLERSDCFRDDCHKLMQHLLRSRSQCTLMGRTNKFIYDQWLTVREIALAHSPDDEHYFIYYTREREREKSARKP
jgi:hypothetical protein